MLKMIPIWASEVTVMTASTQRARLAASLMAARRASKNA